MNYKLSDLVSKVTLISSILIISLLGSAWMIKEYADYTTHVKELKTDYIKKSKEDIFIEINRVISLIDYNYSLKMKRIKKQVKQRVIEAYDLVEKIYEQNKDIKSEDEIIEIIKSSLRNTRFFDNTGYFFIYDTSGKSILHPLKPEIENTYKFKNFTDLNGKEVLSHWIETLKTKNEDYSTWTFYRVDDTSKQALKVGYYKIFKPYNFIIATADYLYRIENELKKETLDRIRQIQYAKTGNIFVITKDGETLVSKYLRKLEGKHYSQLEHAQTSRVIKKILINSTNHGNFITYDWLMPNSKIYQKKLAYIKSYDKWNWVIGTGVFFDEIDSILASKKLKLQQDMMIEAILILFILILILIVLFILNVYIKNKVKNSLEQFLYFFKEVNEKNKKIDLDSIDFYEFSKIAKFANKMIDIKIENERELSLKNREVKVNLSLLDEYKKAVDAGAIISKADAEGTITYVNDQFCSISGFEREELIGKNHNIVKHPEVSDKIFESLWKTILNKKIWKGVFKNKAKNGTSYFVKSTVVPILDLNNNIKEFIAIRYDVTDLVEQAKKIKFQTTDILTKLPNRQKLLEDLSDKNQLKLMVLNIERFKEINEYYGYEIGDKVLIEVSKKLNKLIKNKYFVFYKLQGDEFAFLANKNISEEEFKSICKSLLEQLEKFQVEVEGNILDITFIAGASFVKNYLINAEMAKNHAKQENKRLVIFDENTDIKDNLLNNIYWTKKLKQKIEEDKIIVVIQPIVLNSTKTINKYECLVRMEDDGKLISPIKFLNIAKKSKLYTKLTQIVVEKSFKHFSKTNDSFSINLTLEDILDKKTVDIIKDNFDKYENISNRVIFEIVEDEGIENYEEVRNFIETMKYLGCSIAIDDFGTGYSNFDYLMKLNVDYVKIDGSMIRYLNHDKNAKVVTELIVKFAQKLNIKTIAEFVHSEEIHNIVTDMGIDYSQGFHLGKPRRID